VEVFCLPFFWIAVVRVIVNTCQPALRTSLLSAYGSLVSSVFCFFGLLAAFAGLDYLWVTRVHCPPYERQSMSDEVKAIGRSCLWY
jgi:hypothetical protein